MVVAPGTPTRTDRHGNDKSDRDQLHPAMIPRPARDVQPSLGQLYVFRGGF